MTKDELSRKLVEEFSNAEKRGDIGTCMSILLVLRGRRRGKSVGELSMILAPFAILVVLLDFWLGS